MKKRLLIVLVLALLCAFSGAADEGARDITRDCAVAARLDGRVQSLLDRDITTYATLVKRRDPAIVFTLPPGAACAAAYVCFGHPMMPFVVQARQDGEWADIAHCPADYAQSYVDFAPVTGEVRLLFPTGGMEKSVGLREVFLYSPGDMPADVHIWQPPVDKADLLLLVAHPDDEVLWFGGTLPYYAGELGKNVTVSYMTCGNSGRRLELLEGLWYCGVRNYPDIGNFPDKSPATIAELYKLWGGRDAVYENLVRRIRRYRPEVALTHGADGEHGHSAHILCADALPRAVKLAADPSYDPQSAAEFGAWQVKKVYLHEGEGKLTVMDWRQPLAAFGGATAFDVADAAYALYVSQPHGFRKYRVAREQDKNNSFVYTLVYSAVGEDVIGGDFFENIP